MCGAVCAEAEAASTNIIPKLNSALVICFLIRPPFSLSGRGLFCARPFRFAPAATACRPVNALRPAPVFESPHERRPEHSGNHGSYKERQPTRGGMTTNGSGA